jgi:hypothetical protein
LHAVTNRAEGNAIGKRNLGFGRHANPFSNKNGLPAAKWQGMGQQIEIEIESGDVTLALLSSGSFVSNTALSTSGSLAKRTPRHPVGTSRCDVSLPERHHSFMPTVP